MLTVKQIVTIQNLFGVGSKYVPMVDAMRDEELFPRLSACGAKVREAGRLVPLTAHHVEEAERLAESLLLASEAQGVGILARQGDAYPARLEQAVDEKGLPALPYVLYYKGDISLLKRPCVSIIGTRYPTKEGVETGVYLAREFAKEGFCVVSGLASGCDASAHRGALLAKGKTVAVLAHGLDRVYPAEHSALAREIVEAGGLLLSEYPVGTQVSKYNFIARDRLVSALSHAVIVLQTGVEGGAMYVANNALSLGKPLYSVYYKDESVRRLPVCEGNRRLVELGAQYLRGSDVPSVVELLREASV